MKAQTQFQDRKTNFDNLNYAQTGVYMVGHKYLQNTTYGYRIFNKTVMLFVF